MGRLADSEAAEDAVRRRRRGRVDARPAARARPRGDEARSAGGCASRARGLARATGRP